MQKGKLAGVMWLLLCIIWVIDSDFEWVGFNWVKFGQVEVSLGTW